MKLNRNNEIEVFRGETAAVDFKMSQRADYYVPYLISSERVNPMVCITIGSSRYESKNIVNKQLWLDLNSLNIPRFTQTTVEDLGTISAETEAGLAAILEPGIMYKFLRESEVATGDGVLHFVYEVNDVAIIDEYEFVITLALDDTITLDMMGTDYYYQIELMDTEPMISHIQSIFSTYPNLLNRMPDAFTNTTAGITTYMEQCIAVINAAFPNHWGYRINNPVTSPVASVSNVVMLQGPKRFTVQSVIK